MGVSICEHGGSKILCSNDILYRETTNKVSSTSVIVTCYNDVKDFHFIHSSAKHPIQSLLIESIGNDNIMTDVDFDLPLLILVQPFEHQLSAQKLGNVAIP